jgi:hypothetical protein
MTKLPAEEPFLADSRSVGQEIHLILFDPGVK